MGTGKGSWSYKISWHTRDGFHIKDTELVDKKFMEDVSG